jgi:hypothetical protein
MLALQAAGRLRQLGRGQRLLVMGLPDVSDKIRAAAAASDTSSSTSSSSSSGAEPTVLQLLQWTMDNTVRGSQAGVAEWASQGCHFAATACAPELALQEEKLQLDELYGASRAPEPVGQVLSAIADRHRQICSSSSGEAALSRDVTNRHSLIQQIEQKGRQLGKGYSVIAGSGLSEEVERELQEEEEQEEEVEVQPPLVTPAAESDWQYTAVLQPGASSVQQLCSTAGSSLSVMQLSEVSEQLLAAPWLAGINWSGKVFCTANFVCTTAASLQKVASGTRSSSGTANHLAVGSSGILDVHLRLVDALLLFPSSGEVLLLSEREADALQDMLWKASFGSSSSSGVPVLLSLAYARLAAADGPPGVQQHLRLASPLIATAAVGAGQLRSQSKRLCMSQLRDGTAQLVSLLLFNGSASYGSEAQRKQLRQVMRGKRGAAEVLLCLRGKSALLARSDLELACDDA